MIAYGTRLSFNIRHSASSAGFLSVCISPLSQCHWRSSMKPAASPVVTTPILRRDGHLHHPIEARREETVCILDVRQLEAVRDQRTQVEAAALDHGDEAAH